MGILIKTTQRRKLGFLLFFILIIALGALFYQKANRLEPLPTEKSEILEDSQIQLLGSGDFILRKGFGEVSEWLAVYSGENLNASHIGIVERRQEGVFVWHALDRKGKRGAVHRVSLDFFLRHAHLGSVQIFRDKRLNQRLLVNLERIVREIETLQLPFDHEFDFEDKTELYCTEFVDWAWLQLGFPSFYQGGKTAKFGVMGFNPILQDSNVVKIL